jgi:WD repeat-containing protein 19
VSTTEGDALDQAPVASVPVEIRFSRVKSVSKSNFSEGSVSANLSKTLLLVDVRSSKKPLELDFSKKYGDIVRHEWFGDGYIFLGFSLGYIVVLSTFSEEVGREVYSRKMHSRSFYDIAVSKESNLVATCGDDGIAFLDMSDLQRIHEDERLRIAMRPSGQSGVPMKLEWTSDGQILSVGTHAEKLLSYLVRVPTLVAARGSDVVFLVSLREVAVRSLITGEVKSNHKIDIEPDFLAIGPAHVAVGMNNQVWFYDIRGLSSKEVLSKEFIGTIEKVAISMFFVAVLCDGQVFLQVFDATRQSFVGPSGPKTSGRIQRAFPETEEKCVTCMHLDDKFLIYGTSTGSLVYFSLEDWSVVNEYHHPCGIRRIYPNKSSIRCVLFDEANNAFVYSALDDHLVSFEVDGFDPNDALWDLEIPGVFAVTSASRKVARMYSYAPQSRLGPRVDECFHPDEKHSVYEVETSSENPPLCLSSGFFRANMASGVSEIPTDIYDTKIGKHMTRDQVETRFYWALQLNLLEFAWDAALVLSKSSHWNTLARKAMNLLDVEMAIKSYQKANEIGMVIALMPLQNEGEKALLSGHLSLLLGEYDVAQVGFHICFSLPFLFHSSSAFSTHSLLLVCCRVSFSNQANRFMLYTCNAI